MDNPSLSDEAPWGEAEDLNVDCSRDEYDDYRDEKEYINEARIKAMKFNQTRSELKEFKSIVNDYIAEGYPDYYAEQCAWDIISTKRAIKNDHLKNKVQA